MECLKCGNDLSDYFADWDNLDEQINCNNCNHKMILRCNDFFHDFEDELDWYLEDF